MQEEIRFIPIRGVGWNDTAFKGASIAEGSSPCGGVGWNLTFCGIRFILSCSSPCGGVGCNVQIFKFTTQAFCSSPCGVWVVIPSDSLKNLESTVHPLRGVSWKFGKADSLSNCFVHPYAGMRVVMGITTLNDFKIRSSPCGDVGWNCKNSFIEFNNIAFIPIRGCGLK